jgi:type II secretory pathway component PulM
MTGSSWKSNLDPQIAARNRWAHHRYVRPGEVAEAGSGHALEGRSRGIVAAVGVALAVAAVVLFFVVALHSSPSQMTPLAPAAPAQHSATADAAEHVALADAATDPSVGGGGSGHATAQ